MKTILTALLFFSLNLIYAQTNIELKVPVTVQKLNTMFGKYTEFLFCGGDTDFCNYGNEYIWQKSNYKIDGFSTESGDVANNIDKIDIITITAPKSVITVNGLSINKTTLSACKLKYGSSFKKSLSNQYKIKTGNYWTYLTFNTKNILKEVVLVTWEYDTTG